MYQVVNSSQSGIDYVKDGVLYRGSTGGGVLVESVDDLAELPAYRPGTLAHTAGYTHVWETDSDGEWIVIK